MLFQTDFSRLFAAYIGGTFVVLVHTYLSYKIIRRKKKNKIALSLLSYFVFMAIGFGLNLVYIPLKIDPLLYILYLISAFCALYGISFLTLSLICLHYQEKIQLKFIIIIETIIAIIVLLILSIPNGIRYDYSTNWRPEYSWMFFTFAYLYIIGLILIPSTFLIIKILQNPYEKRLKKKLRIFFIGEVIFIIASLGLVLYNTWDNSLFRTIWGYIIVINFIPAWLMYYGLGKEF